MTLSSSDDKKTELAFFDDDYRLNEWSGKPIAQACLTISTATSVPLFSSQWVFLPIAHTSGSGYLN
ncbi:hypothetical protein [Pseudomonas sp. dw_612]|uniref:hypothetical protein n=1 Tax=Pseudomonas sp. dw_612 TaxID=2720080 RepID=UPI001BD441C3|nr:hypothetical protein [Pseudomonas sp. dw_612]